MLFATAHVLSVVQLKAQIMSKDLYGYASRRRLTTDDTHDTPSTRGHDIGVDTRSMCSRHEVQVLNVESFSAGALGSWQTASIGRVKALRRCACCTTCLYPRAGLLRGRSSRGRCFAVGAT